MATTNAKDNKSSGISKEFIINEGLFEGLLDIINKRWFWNEYIKQDSFVKLPKMIVGKVSKTVLPFSIYATDGYDDKLKMVNDKIWDAENLAAMNKIAYSTFKLGNSAWDIEVIDGRCEVIMYDIFTCYPGFDDRPHPLGYRAYSQYNLLDPKTKKLKSYIIKKEFNDYTQTASVNVLAGASFENFHIDQIQPIFGIFGDYDYEILDKVPIQLQDIALNNFYYPMQWFGTTLEDDDFLFTPYNESIFRCTDLIDLVEKMVKIWVSTADKSEPVMFVSPEVMQGILAHMEDIRKQSPKWYEEHKCQLEPANIIKLGDTTTANKTVSFINPQVSAQFFSDTIKMFVKFIGLECNFGTDFISLDSPVSAGGSTATEVRVKMTRELLKYLNQIRSIWGPKIVKATQYAYLVLTCKKDKKGKPLLDKQGHIQNDKDDIKFADSLYIEWEELEMSRLDKEQQGANLVAKKCLSVLDFLQDYEGLDKATATKYYQNVIADQYIMQKAQADKLLQFFDLNQFLVAKPISESKIVDVPVELQDTRVQTQLAKANSTYQASMLSGSDKAAAGDNTRGAAADTDTKTKKEVQSQITTNK